MSDTQPTRWPDFNLGDRLGILDDRRFDQLARDLNALNIACGKRPLRVTAPALKLTLRCILLRAGSSDVAFPTWIELGEYVGVTKSTIWQTLMGLVEAGLVSKHARARQRPKKIRGEDFANEYTIDLNRLMEMPLTARAIRRDSIKATRFARQTRSGPHGKPHQVCHANPNGSALQTPDISIQSVPPLANGYTESPPQARTASREAVSKLTAANMLAGAGVFPEQIGACLEAIVDQGLDPHQRVAEVLLAVDKAKARRKSISPGWIYSAITQGWRFNNKRKRTSPT